MTDALPLLPALDAHSKRGVFADGRASGVARAGQASGGCVEGGCGDGRSGDLLILARRVMSGGSGRIDTIEVISVRLPCW